MYIDFLSFDVIFNKCYKFWGGGEVFFRFIYLGSFCSRFSFLIFRIFDFDRKVIIFVYIF